MKYDFYNVAVTVQRGKMWKPQILHVIVRTKEYWQIKPSVEKVLAKSLEAQIVENSKGEKIEIPKGRVIKIDARKMKAEFFISDTEPFVKEEA